VIAHSFGGGVAMQFAYQFPGKVERLVLVSSGGVTKDVHPVLRMVSVPVVSEVLKLLRVPGAMPAMRLAGSALGQLNRTPLRVGAVFHDASDLVRILGGLPDPTACEAYLRTLRAVVDWRGQVVTMLDRSYLTEDLPVQLIWGDRDTVIPVGHAYLAHSAMPGSRLEVFRGAGHFPFRDDPLRFLKVVETFLENTAPLQFDEESWRRLLVSGVSESGITGGPATRMAVLDVMESDERSAT